MDVRQEHRVVPIPPARHALFFIFPPLVELVEALYQRSGIEVGEQPDFKASSVLSYMPCTTCFTSQALTYSGHQDGPGDPSEESQPQSFDNSQQLPTLYVLLTYSNGGHQVLGWVALSS